MITNRLYLEDVQAVAESDLPWEDLQGRSVLITGGTGLIGSFLVDTLMFRNRRHAAATRILVLGRDVQTARTRFGACAVTELAAEGDGLRNFLNGPATTVFFLRHDVTRPFPLPEVRFDFLIHAASNTHPNAYATDPVGTITTNVRGLQELLDHAVRTRAKRLYVLSSVEIYGENRAGLSSFDEGSSGHIDCNTLRAGYPESKRLSESLAQAYAAQHGVDVVVGRFPRVYGPTMRMDDSKAVAQFIRNAVRGEDIVLKSDGSQCFSFCYVADAVLGLLATLLKGARGEAYNIAGTASAATLRELAGVLAARAGRRVVFHKPDDTESRGFSTATHAVLNGAKIAALDYAPRYTVRDGLVRTVDILREEAMRHAPVQASQERSGCCTRTTTNGR